MRSDKNNVLVALLPHLLRWSYGLKLLRRVAIPRLPHNSYDKLNYSAHICCGRRLANFDFFGDRKPPVAVGQPNGLSVATAISYEYHIRMIYIEAGIHRIAFLRPPNGRRRVNVSAS